MIYLFWPILFGSMLAGGFIARHRGVAFFIGCACGILLGPLGVLIACFLRPRKVAQGYDKYPS